MNDTSPSPQTWVARTFTNPYVGMVGWCASVISIPLAFYFYFASIEKPDLTYYIRPDRSPLVAAGDTPDLAIIYKGHEVSKNVSAAQITIWNAGKKPIQHDEILAPFVISTEANHPILAAKVISVTRPVIGFHLDDSAVGSDRLGIDWRVLEFNDGVLVQVIYEGDTSVPIHVNGSYLGQRTISVRTLPFGYQTDADKNPINKLSRYLRPIAGVTSSMAVFMGLLFNIQRFSRRRGQALPLADISAIIAFAALTLAGVGLSFYDFHQILRSLPPFGY